MGIKETIEKVEYYDKERNTLVEDYIGKEENNQKTTKIIISTALFIYKQYIEGASYTVVDVIPFNQLKELSAVIKDKEKAEIFVG